MKVYVVYESNYGEILSDNGFNATDIIGVFFNKNEALKCKMEHIKIGKENGYIVDEEIEDINNCNDIIMFREYQENWNCYYEIRIEEREVE